LLWAGCIIGVVCSGEALGGLGSLGVFESRKHSYMVELVEGKLQYIEGTKSYMSSPIWLQIAHMLLARWVERLNI
jgi:hypothetical protein